MALGRRPRQHEEVSDRRARHVAVSLLLAVVASAVAAAAWRVQLDFTTTEHVLETVGGLSLVAAALVVRWQRVDNRLVWLLYAAGLLWFVGDFQHLPDETWLADLAWAWSGWHSAVLVWAVLAFPTGVLRTTAARVLAGSALGLMLARSLSRTFLHVPSDPAGFGTRNRYLPITDDTAWRWSEDILAWGITVATFLSLVAVCVRMSRASAPGRRMLAPVLVAATALSIATAYSTRSGWNAPLLGLRSIDVVTGTYVVIAASMAFGLLRLRHLRGSVIDLVKQLGGDVRPDRIGDALAQVLGDVRVQLLAWSPERAEYVDESGRPTTPPAPTPERAVTAIEYAGTPVAVLVHDLVLLEDPALVEGVTAAVRLAVHNETLHAQLRAQLAEVAASRARIVEAADAERRRIERNLHDGAQQRLLAVAVGLNIALQRLPDHADHDARVAMKHAVTELGGAIDELRALARGLHPAILSEAGLVPALESLTDRATGDVELICELVEEPPLQHATAVYFAVSEALSNITRHANAQHVQVTVQQREGVLVVTVTDDGVGGADLEAGTGLLGMRDRIRTLGGELRLRSDEGGTQVEVTLPCASS
jgi:signal transduction histidine kinase